MEPYKDYSYKLPSQSEMAELDRLTIEKGTSEEELMERAGAAVLEEIRRLDLDLANTVILCGPGNNGGDGLVIARLLEEEGFSPSVVSSRSQEFDLSTVLTSATLVIDALLGTGQRDAPRGAVLEIIRSVTANLNEVPTVAVDIPTGINGDTGEVYTDHLKADYTVCIQLVKRGLYQSPASDCCGTVSVVDIGIDCSSEVEFSLSSSKHLRLLPPREKSSHKGNFGHVLVVGGSQDMPGAPILAGTAALRTGAGLVSVTHLGRSAPEIERPELMYRSIESLDEIMPFSNDYQSIVIGPGLCNSPSTQEAVLKLLKTVTEPIILDADGLNAIASVDLGDTKFPNCIFTPHPGEAARLLDMTSRDIQSDRYTAAREIAERYGCIVVLKGAHTITYSVSHGLVNPTGNPYMATAGSGDVLAGTIAALVAQGLGLSDAASLGAYAHGLAGDLAHQRTGGPIIAGDIIEAMPLALGELT